MKFSEVVDQASEFLRRRERVSYRALKREFDLDDESLEDLKAELIDAQRIAVDEDGKVLVWLGKGGGVKGRNGNTGGDKDKRIREQGIKEDTEDQAPSRWTPAHLAERIRAAEVSDGERKTITALFADLKGSTAWLQTRKLCSNSSR